MKLVLASRNAHKAREFGVLLVRVALDDGFWFRGDDRGGPQDREQPCDE